ncbi:MAG: hypothetical protein R3F30_10380 [Planctomycetota bacterium]
MTDAKADQDAAQRPDQELREQDSWREVDDTELGEILGEALAEAAGVVQAVEELDAPAAEPAARVPRRREARGRRGSSLDTVLAFVLLLNVAFMVAVVLVPEPGRGGAPEPTPAPTPAPPRPEGAGQAGPETSPPRPKEAPLESRVVQMAEIERLVATGDYAKAIAMLEGVLRDQAELPGSVRRAILSRLAHYAGEAGDHEKALRYLRMSNSGFEISLLPADLWSMAVDARRLGDFKGARKYVARFLLQESLMSDEHRQRIPAAYLELADGYRIEATESEKKTGGAEEHR